MIEIHGLSKTFPNGTRALHDVSLSVEPGEFTVLLGPSGAGKSTLLRCINGLVTGSEGQVRVGGRLVRPGSDLRLVRQQVGMVFQQFNLVKRLTVLENVLCGRLSYASSFLSSLRLFTAEDVGLAEDALRRVGLPDKAHSRADQLSGGQQQRVGIARALVQRPSIILADEPVASLDPVSAHRVIEILAEINQRDRVTIIASLHDPRLAREFGRRIVGLSHGRLVLDCPASALGPAGIARVYERPPDVLGESTREEAVAVASA